MFGPPPRISGSALVALTQLARTTPGALGLRQLFRAELKIAELARLPQRLFGPVTLDTTPMAGRPKRRPTAPPYSTPIAPPWSGSAQALTTAYRTGVATPVEITKRAFEKVRAMALMRPTMSPMLACLDDSALADARASAERYARREPLGPLDGVPFTVKEELGLAGLPALDGSTLLDSTVRERDSTCVAKLRAGGAVLLGHTVMTEFGMNPLGCNPKRNMPRNAHSTGHLAGGSSTGAAIAAAFGIGPFAIGVDGGGSIRIPAAMNGIFGIKPTWGRVSRHGAICTGSVAHIGPLGASTLDLALSLELMSGHDAADPQTATCPPLAPNELTAALERSVVGLRIGVLESEWRDASPDIAAGGRAALAALEKAGAVIVPVKMELARYASPIGYLAIGLEDLNFDVLYNHMDQLNADLQVSYTVLTNLGAVDVCLGQRLRGGLRRELANVMRDVDVLALPTTATTAPPVTSDELERGFVDSVALDAVCRFSFLANLTGLPALTVPTGMDRGGLPMGLQFVGDAGDEATLIGVSANLERLGVARVTRPKGATSLLE